MSDAGQTTISVVIARVERGGVRLDTMLLPGGSTLAQALAAARRANLIGPQTLAHCTVAVFGRRRAPDDRLRDGDRIELLGPLSADPKEARQRRVALARAAAGRSKWRPDR